MSVIESDLEVEPIARHSLYYISSGDVIFLVQSRLFCVHRYFFVRESVKFRDMLSKCSPYGSNTEGTSDASAIHLPGFTSEEFSSFLWVFYNDDYTRSASIEQWSSILRLSHLWQFANVKRLAIKELDKLDIPAVDKAVMACAYDVDPSWQWRETAYAELGARDEPIRKEEGVRLGLDVVLKLVEVRERIRDRRNKSQIVPEKSSYEPCLSIPGPSPPEPHAVSVSIIDNSFNPPYRSSRRSRRRRW